MVVQSPQHPPPPEPQGLSSPPPPSVRVGLEPRTSRKLLGIYKNHGRKSAEIKFSWWFLPSFFFTEMMLLLVETPYLKTTLRLIQSQLSHDPMDEVRGESSPHGLTFQVGYPLVN